MQATKAKSPATSSMNLAVIDRRNQTVVKSVPFPDAQNPYLVPPPETIVWHYVRYEHFRALLKNKAIWFTRLDKQSDKTDGTYAQTNASKMTPTLKNLMNSLNISEGPDWAGLLQTNEILRKKAYVHCWSIRPRESAWMWHFLLQDKTRPVEDETRSVAIRSTIGRIQAALRGQSVDFMRIIYYPPGVPRPDWSYTAPFAAKDKPNYKEERELRLMTTTEIGVADEADHKLIPSDLSALIGKIVVHPSSSPEFRDEVRIELKRYSIDVHVARSEVRSCDLQAVARSMR